MAQTRNFFNLVYFLSMAVLFLPYIAYSSNFSWRQADQRPGYESEIEPEKEDVGEILYSLPNPTANDKLLKDQIFSEKLKNEFTQRYTEQFGRTEPEIIYNRTPYLNSNYTEGQSQTFDEEEYQEQQKKFGNFMAKRLVEFHIQNEAKTNPQLKAVNDVKESVEKVDVSFAKDYKLRLKYHIASDTLRMNLINPYADFGVRMELANTLNFANTEETVFTFRKYFESLKLTALTDYYVTQKRWDLVGVRSLTPWTSVSLTISPFRELEFEANQFVIERLIVAGVNIIF